MLHVSLLFLANLYGKKSIRRSPLQVSSFFVGRVLSLLGTLHISIKKRHSRSLLANVSKYKS